MHDFNDSERFSYIEQKLYCDIVKLACVIKLHYFDTYYQNIVISDISTDKAVFRRTMNGNDGNEIYIYCVVTDEMIINNKLDNIVKFIHKVFTVTCEYIKF